MFFCFIRPIREIRVRFFGCGLIATLCNQANYTPEQFPRLSCWAIQVMVWLTMLKFFIDPNPLTQN